MTQMQADDMVQSAPSGPLVVLARLRRLLADVMRVDAHEVLAPPDEVIAFRGQVYDDTEAAFAQISRRFAEVGYTAWLRDGPQGGHEVVATKGVAERKPGRVWINGALFLATVLSVLYAGALYALSYYHILTPDEALARPFNALIVMPLRHLYIGVPFAATLLGILVAHELSHYFVARRNGSPTSLPFFIPLPMPDGLGTMGAVIVQQAPMRNRKTLFDIGAAGPVGGLIVAIPLLILGLALSDVGTLSDFGVPPGVGVTKEGDSLLYMGLKYAVKGEFLPAGEGDFCQQRDVWLSPVAWAAWAGLLVTTINLIPVGQLDGGHISYALLGRRAWTLGYVFLAAMVAWGGWLVFSGNQAGGLWLMWAFLNLLLNRRHPPPVDDVTKLGWPRVVLGLVMLVIFILLFMPWPLQGFVC